MTVHSVLHDDSLHLKVWNNNGLICILLMRNIFPKKYFLLS